MSLGLVVPYPGQQQDCNYTNMYQEHVVCLSDNPWRWLISFHIIHHWFTYSFTCFTLDCNCRHLRDTCACAVVLVLTCSSSTYVGAIATVVVHPFCDLHGLVNALIFIVCVSFKCTNNSNLLAPASALCGCKL
jgi:hypothetical protein